MKEEFLDSAYNAFKIESESILATGEGLDREEFRRAVEALANADRIAAAGCGHSGIACRHFAHLMCCIDLPARFLSPAEAVHGGLGYLHEGDVLLIVSRGGKTDELIPIAEVARVKGATVICVTEKLESPLAQLSDIKLKMTISRECDKYNCQGTTSFAVTSAIFDALQTALLEYTDYKNETFALIHPGGAVGKRLNNK
jgi:D-arabinose 5-phosphate isomerase GutQ